MSERQVPRGPKNLKCPQWQKAMSAVCHTCPLWTQVRGKDPQTSSEVDQWNCALAFLPMLSLEIAQQVRQGAAATESFRNETQRAHHESLAYLAGEAQARDAYGQQPELFGPTMKLLNGVAG